MPYPSLNSVAVARGAGTPRFLRGGDVALRFGVRGAFFAASVLGTVEPRVPIERIRTIRILETLGAHAIFRACRTPVRVGCKASIAVCARSGVECRAIRSGRMPSAPGP